MTLPANKALAERNGYTVHELFVNSGGNQYDSIGFAVFDPDANIVNVMPTLKLAQEHLHALDPAGSSQPGF